MNLTTVKQIQQHIESIAPDVVWHEKGDTVVGEIQRCDSVVMIFQTYYMDGKPACIDVVVEKTIYHRTMWRDSPDCISDFVAEMKEQLT